MPSIPPFRYDLCMEAEWWWRRRGNSSPAFSAALIPNRLCFGYNSTDALNLAIAGCLEPGDHAITTLVEHNSVLRPPLSPDAGSSDRTRLRSVQREGLRRSRRLTGSFSKKNTRLVAVNHGSNVIGTVQPIREIGKLCRDRGITFLIDASQTAGKIPIHLEKDNLDIIAFTGHKSLLGPMGIGGLYVREGVEVRHTRAGGTGVRSAVRTHLNEYPYRLEYGTPPIRLASQGSMPESNGSRNREWTSSSNTR
jgi:selenocysteine lyase/cysteine desulfurase